MNGKEMARKLAFVLCCVCFAGCCIFLIAWFVNGQLVKARNQKLAEQFHTVRYAGAEQGEAGGTQQSAAAKTDEKQKMDELRRENEDTVGWIFIDGAEVDYPIVQYKDNEYYLNRNFWRQKDRYGAIFMDQANTEGFAAPHVILYGHNMQDGAMFGALTRYLSADFLAKNPTVAVILPDGGTIFYRIFSARKIYADDPAYRVGFADKSEFAAFAAALGAPDTAAPLLTLSTCADGADYTERVVVHAALVDTQASPE